MKMPRTMASRVRSTGPCEATVAASVSIPASTPARMIVVMMNRWNHGAWTMIPAI
jgi:hypothetical protein